MIKIKKIIKFLAIVVVTLFIVTGCGNKIENNNSVAVNIINEFKETIKNSKDLEKITKDISKSKSIKIAVDYSEIKEGYLNGFDNEIKGFNEGYVIQPMIGSQPFIIYTFKSDDVESLKINLEKNANKRWNICTEADDLEIYSENNYVILVMSPSKFDD